MAVFGIRKECGVRVFSLIESIICPLTVGGTVNTNTVALSVWKNKETKREKLSIINCVFNDATRKC